jgi:hypothetical protein
LDAILPLETAMIWGHKIPIAARRDTSLALDLAPAPNDAGPRTNATERFGNPELRYSLHGEALLVGDGWSEILGEVWIWTGTRGARGAAQPPAPLFCDRHLPRERRGITGLR